MGRGAAVQGLGARPCSIARRSGNLKKAALGTFSEKGNVYGKYSPEIIMDTSTTYLLAPG